MKKYFTIFALGMMALSTAAFAGTTASNSNTVSPTLQKLEWFLPAARISSRAHSEVAWLPF